MDPDIGHAAAGTPVVIFDHGEIQDGTLGLRERIAACFRLANLNGWSVEEVCGTEQGSLDDELERAVTICEHIGANLLAYADTWRITHPTLQPRLAAIGLLTVQRPAAVS